MHSSSKSRHCRLKMRRAPLQCSAFTKAKKRCSITSESKLVTDSGRLACEPLLRGSRYCLFHTQIFNAHPADVPFDAKLFYLDFETTGLNVLTESIVEIGLLDESGNAIFSTVVRPPVLSGDETPVHGISSEELADGPTFAEAFERLVRFAQSVVEMSLEEDSDSSCGEIVTTQALKDNLPTISVAAHNGCGHD